MNELLTELIPFSLEILIALTAAILLVLGLYGSLSKAIWWISGICIIVSIILFTNNESYLSQGEVLEGMTNDQLTSWFKAVLLSFTALILLFYGGLTRVKVWNHGHHEYVILVLLASVGGMAAISARNFLFLYVALELMALVSYVLASYDRENKLSSEAGMKYFILGSLSSCVLVFGMSYIYGFSGSLSFNSIQELIFNGTYSVGLLTGIMIFIIGILFKLSVAPFHFWTPDIYQGSPLISVAFFSSVPKFTSVIVLINIVNLVISDIQNLWSPFFVILSIISMIVGSVGAIVQKSFKRLMGYSAVLNLGFVLLAISTGTKQGYDAAIMYQIIYSVSSIGLFATLAITSIPDSGDYEISQLRGFGRVKKMAAFAIGVFMFSFVGIPPLAGFFGKFYVIAGLVGKGYYLASVCALLISVISAFYYINIVKVMYFMQPEEKQIRLHESSSLGLVITFCAGFVLIFPLIQHLL